MTFTLNAQLSERQKGKTAILDPREIKEIKINIVGKNGKNYIWT